MRHQIATGDYNFDDKVWDDVSPSAKDFILKVLIVDRNKRMSLKQCRSHPWILQGTAKADAAVEIFKHLLHTKGAFGIFSKLPHELVIEIIRCLSPGSSDLTSIQLNAILEFAQSGMILQIKGSDEFLSFLKIDGPLRDTTAKQFHSSHLH
eukprot:TRINITY_DN1697_c0_g1_i3.p1 TRINITY_DN1697_c0_g1~~TRINITY_DN1697_c0_g1_i3.p1  ORF type:complete len:151 (+),score=23.81 TRINITY_DN1697_c0_g1_i3:332-784(+)